MPAKLKVSTEFRKWRIRTEDLELLAAIHGEGNINTVVREDIIHLYCEALRRKLAGRAASGG